MQLIVNKFTSGKDATSS